MKIKKTIIENIDCDTKRLYGPLDEAISYLKEIQDKYPLRDLRLCENWYGYEDMELVFSYSRSETDEELELRLKEEERKRKFLEQEEKAKKHKEKDLAEFRRLKTKLGL